jgi:hypothetical protein
VLEIQGGADQGEADGGDGEQGRLRDEDMGFLVDVKKDIFSLAIYNRLNSGSEHFFDQLPRNVL